MVNLAVELSSTFGQPRPLLFNLLALTYNHFFIIRFTEVGYRKMFQSGTRHPAWYDFSSRNYVYKLEGASEAWT